jgi:segregation and condensation protein B
VARNSESGAEEAPLASAIESVLLVASEAVPVRALARLLDTDGNTIKRSIDYLAAELAGRGIRVQSHDGRLQLVTAPENAAVVREFLRLPRQPRVSRPALETLAIVSYRQPVTKSEIEEIRGVNADRVVANLVSRGVIEEKGRREAPGRPIEYGTTGDFLELFGLASLDELPPLPLEPPVAPAASSILGMTDRLAGDG